MSPTFELKSEHRSMSIILDALEKAALEMQQRKNLDFLRLSQIVEFLWIYNDGCHHEKEEQFLFPAMLECGSQWTADTICSLSEEHASLREHLRGIENKLREYQQGQRYIQVGQTSFILEYIKLQKKHIEIENTLLFPLSEKILSPFRQESMLLSFKNLEGNKVDHVKHLEFFILLSNLYTESSAVEPTISFFY